MPAARLHALDRGAKRDGRRWIIDLLRTGLDANAEEASAYVVHGALLSHDRPATTAPGPTGQIYANAANVGPRRCVTQYQKGTPGIPFVGDA